MAPLLTPAGAGVVALSAADALDSFAHDDDLNSLIAVQRQQIALVVRCDEIGIVGQRGAST